MTRLFSAVYDDYFPFYKINGVNDAINSSNPDLLKDGDMLIVWGGGDISPALYNRGRSRYTHAMDTPSQRDKIEWALMQRAKELGIPIIGVCRGAQMLCALVGGYLIQHVENHMGMHDVLTYDNKRIKVNSIHHQMLYPFDVEHEMIAWSDTIRSSVHYDIDVSVEMPIEPEFVYFPQCKGFAIQWHPEMMDEDSPANQYVINFINTKVAQNVEANSI